MATQQSRQFLLGLPATGKTTFLAALWHVVNSVEVEGALELERLHGNQKHLNEIRNLWSDVRALERTKVGSEKFISMLLKDSNRNSVTEVIFPDLSGESFISQWVHRKMKKDHAELVREAVGGLLLIHPDTVTEEALIPETEHIIEGMRTEMQGERPTAVVTNQISDAGTNQMLAEVDWNPEKAPTQILLVDLLQFIAALNTRRPIKLAVVVSAWDRITITISPSKWIENRLPLLSQYLTAHHEIFFTEFYGISAQGGNLDDADELRKNIRPSDRIHVIKNDLSESHDITIPIQWIIEPLV